MNDPLPTWLLPTLPGTPNVTSSQASEAGASLPAWLVGPTTENCGPEAAPASRSVSRGKVKGRRTKGTSGLKCSDSSVPDGPMSSWESKLRQRLSTVGSIRCSMIWKVATTPAGRSLSRHVPLGRTIGVTAYGGFLPTPSGTSNHGKNHVSGRLDEWGGSSNPWRGTEDGKLHCVPFELWMMGFSDVWRQQMPPAMPSSRKLRPK